MKLTCAALAALLLSAGCARTEVRFTPSTALPPARMAPVASFKLKDSSGGLQTRGIGVLLKRPFADTFRDAVSAQLAALHAAPSGTGVDLEIELTGSLLKRGEGFTADLTSYVTYTVLVSSAGSPPTTGTIKILEKMREGFFTSPVGPLLEKTLARAMADLDSYLDPTNLMGRDEPAGTPRDPKAWALVIGVGKSRSGRAVAGTPAADARAAAEFARTALRVPADHLAMLIDEQASMADVNKFIQGWIPEHAAPDDRVFVFYSGRVAADSAGAAYLLPYDADPAYLAQTAFPLSFLYGMLERLQAQTTVVFAAGAGSAAGAPKNAQVILAGPDLGAALASAQAEAKP